MNCVTRVKKIGMIFQHFNLMNTLSVFDNVLSHLKKRRDLKSRRRGDGEPLDPTAEPKLVKLTKAEIKERKWILSLQLVGLEDKANSYPNQLSQGQKATCGDCPCVVNDPTRIAL